MGDVAGEEAGGSGGGGGPSPLRIGSARFDRLEEKGRPCVGFFSRYEFMDTVSSVRPTGGKGGPFVGIFLRYEFMNAVR